MLNSFGGVQPVQHVVTWVSKSASAPVTIMARLISPQIYPQKLWTGRKAQTQALN